jgi:hypothetical protein
MSKYQDDGAARRPLEILENTHDSLKWLWQVSMGSALAISSYTAFEAFIYISRGSAESEKYFLVQDYFDPKGVAIISILSYLFVFLPLFIRFFYGDNRYLDLHYIELRDLTKKDLFYFRDAGHRYSGASRFLDIALLMSHSIVFIFMGKSIVYPDLFSSLVIVLMGANICWLLFVIYRNRNNTKKYFITSNGSESLALNAVSNTQKLYGNVETRSICRSRDWVLWRWAMNNLAHLVLVVGILLLVYGGKISVEEYMYAFIVIMLSNSVLDFILTWEFYFPRLDELMKLSKMEQSSEENEQQENETGDK